jgi:hypothetical protein
MVGNASSLKHSRSVLGMVTLVLMSGCSTLGGQSVETEEPWTRPWRTQAHTTSRSGLDSQAIEIERNLGVY